MRIIHTGLYAFCLFEINSFSNFFFTVDHYDISHTSLAFQVIPNIYTRLLVFGLRANSAEVLEGESQKTFANSLNFFQELLEVSSELRAVLSNLVQQLQAIYSGDLSKSSNNVNASYWNVHFKTVVLSLAEGFAMLVTIDELVAQNPLIGQAFHLFIRSSSLTRNYLSECRRDHKVRYSARMSCS
jgi:hypothetical protein